MSDRMAMDSPLVGTASPEKVLWYQEVLSLDPNSRIFLPYARLLAELDRRTEAMDVLRAGLLRHPEFLEARLFLIELMHAAGLDAAAGLEAEGIIEQLSQSTALWQIWSRRPGLRADQAAMLLFFAAGLKKDGLRLGDVFEAGISALNVEKNEVKASASSSTPEEPVPPVKQASPSSTLPQPFPAAELSDAPADEPARVPAFVMDDTTPWYSLDAVPEDDDILDDADAVTVMASPVQALLFAEAAADSLSAETEETPSAPSQNSGERIPAMATVPKSAMEGKSSLCTRSMARILEEQGATGEAADIYRELLEHCSSPEEKDELNAKLTRLLQGTENTAAPSSSGMFDLLETLAVRLENRSRA